MRLPWHHDRCILCLFNARLTDEHIISEHLGGRLVVAFLCHGCNSRMGEGEDALKRDPSIRIAVEHLSVQIPQLAAALTEGQRFFVESERGRVAGTVKDGRFKIRGGKAPDGSVILPTDEGRIALARLLAKDYVAPDVEQLLGRFDRAPENTEIDLGTWGAVKWSRDHPRPSLTDPLVGEVPVLKMAYEFLACHLDSTIYDTRLDPLRAAIVDPPGPPGTYRVERGAGTEYRPLHGLALEAAKPNVIIQIRLFGWLPFRVHFPRLAWDGLRTVYTVRLTDRAEDWREIAKKKE